MNLKKRLAFTMIELLVVVVIIGILVSVAIPQYQLAVKKAEWGQAIIVIDALYNAVKYYYDENGAWPPNEDCCGSGWWAGGGKTSPAGINKYLSANDMDIRQIAANCCDDFWYDIYQGGPDKCGAVDNDNCAITAGRIGKGVGMLKRLISGEVKTSGTVANYP